jgi:HD superfamily phosphodiesterase
MFIVTTTVQQDTFRNFKANGERIDAAIALLKCSGKASLVVLPAGYLRARVNSPEDEILNVAKPLTKLAQQLDKAIVVGVSYKGANVPDKMCSIEGQIVQDADRLDAIGAIGIARAFSYGGNKNRAIYLPDIDPEFHDNFEDYSKAKGHTINHFYEKLLLLKDRLHTRTAKKIGQQRHNLMEDYLEQFYNEWNTENLNK